MLEKPKPKDPKSKPTSADQSIPQHWREERAYRSGRLIAWVLIAVCTVALCLNLVYATALKVLADVVLIAGCGASLFLTQFKKPQRTFVWWPIYISFFVAIIPSMFATGGVYSPWVGIYLAGLGLIGTVFQVRFSPLYNTALILLYLTGWAVYQYFYPITEIITYPLFFMWASNTISMMGIGYFLHSLLRTENHLSEQFQNQYKELYETRANLVREENANQAKTDFLANVSHELRTPLGAMLGYAQLLQEDRVSLEDKKTFAAAIERNGLQLTRLVDDLLDLSKVEAGEIKLEKIDFNIRDLLEDVLDLFRVQAMEKGIQLAAHAESNVPEFLNADPYRLKQILTNVVGNALKFTSRGSIRLSVECANSSPNVFPCELILKVRDTGRGISQEERQKIFKRFSQADTSTTRRYGGTGLGLNFSQQLAWLFNGNLKLNWSEPGVGSEFVLRIQTHPLQGKTAGESHLLFH